MSLEKFTTGSPLPRGFSAEQLSQLDKMKLFSSPRALSEIIPPKRVFEDKGQRLLFSLIDNLQARLEPRLDDLRNKDLSQEEAQKVFIEAEALYGQLLEKIKEASALSERPAGDDFPVLTDEYRISPVFEETSASENSQEEVVIGVGNQMTGEVSGTALSTQSGSPVPESESGVARVSVVESVPAVESQSEIKRPDDELSQSEGREQRLEEMGDWIQEHSDLIDAILMQIPENERSQSIVSRYQEYETLQDALLEAVNDSIIQLPVIESLFAQLVRSFDSLRVSISEEYDISFREVSSTKVREEVQVVPEAVPASGDSSPTEVSPEQSDEMIGLLEQSTRLYKELTELSQQVSGEVATMEAMRKILDEGEVTTAAVQDSYEVLMGSGIRPRHLADEAVSILSTTHVQIKRLSELVESARSLVAQSNETKSGPVSDKAAEVVLEVPAPSEQFTEQTSASESSSVAKLAVEFRSLKRFTGSNGTFFKISDCLERTRQVFKMETGQNTLPESLVREFNRSSGKIAKINQEIESLKRSGRPENEVRVRIADEQEKIVYEYQQLGEIVALALERNYRVVEEGEEGEVPTEVEVAALTEELQVLEERLSPAEKKRLEDSFKQIKTALEKAAQVTHNDQNEAKNLRRLYLKKARKYLKRIREAAVSGGVDTAPDAAPADEAQPTYLDLVKDDPLLQNTALNPSVNSDTPSFGQIYDEVEKPTMLELVKDDELITKERDSKGDPNNPDDWQIKPTDTSSSQGTAIDTAAPSPAAPEETVLRDERLRAAGIDPDAPTHERANYTSERQAGRKYLGLETRLARLDMNKYEEAYRATLFAHRQERVGKKAVDTLKSVRGVSSGVAALGSLKEQWQNRKSSTEHLEQLRAQADAAAERYREKLLDQLSDRLAGRSLPTALTADGEGIKAGLQRKLVEKSFLAEAETLAAAKATIASEKDVERAAFRQKWEKTAATAERLAKLLPKNPRARLALGLAVASATGATMGIVAVGAATGVATFGAAAGVGALAGAGRWAAATGLGMGAGALAQRHEGKRVKRIEDRLQEVLKDSQEADVIPIAKARQAARLANAQVDSAKLRRAVLPKAIALTAALGSRGLMGAYDVLSPTTAAEQAAGAAEMAVAGFDEAFGGVPFARIPGSGLIQGLRTPNGVPLPDIEISNMAIVAERGDGLPVDVYEQAKIRGAYWLAVKDYYKPNIPIEKLEQLVFERLENKFSGEEWWQKAGIKEFRILGGIKEAVPIPIEPAASAASAAAGGESIPDQAVKTGAAETPQRVEVLPVRAAEEAGTTVTAPSRLSATVASQASVEATAPAIDTPQNQAATLPEVPSTPLTEPAVISDVQPEGSLPGSTVEAIVPKPELVVEFTAEVEPPSYIKAVAIEKINKYVPDAKEVTVEVGQGTMKVAGIERPTTEVVVRVVTSAGDVLETKATGVGVITDKNALGTLLISATEDLPGARPAIVKEMLGIERPATGRLTVASQDPLGEFIETLPIENKSISSRSELVAAAEGVASERGARVGATSEMSVQATGEAAVSTGPERRSIPLPPNENIPSGKYLASEAYQRYLRENGVSMDRLNAQVKATVAGFEGKTYTGLWDEMRHRSPYQELGKMTVGDIEALRKSMWGNEAAIRDYAKQNGFKYETLMKWANQMDYMKQDTTLPVNPNTTMEDWINRFIAKMMIEKNAVASGQGVDLPTPPRGSLASTVDGAVSRPSVSEVASSTESVVDSRINRMVRSIEKGNPLLDNDKYESPYTVLATMKTSDVEALRVAARSNPTALYKFAQEHNVSLTLVRKWMLKVDTMIGVRPLPEGTTFANWLSSQISHDIAQAKQMRQVTASWSPRR